MFWNSWKKVNGIYGIHTRCVEYDFGWGFCPIEWAQIFHGSLGCFSEFGPTWGWFNLVLTTVGVIWGVWPAKVRPPTQCKEATPLKCYIDGPKMTSIYKFTIKIKLSGIFLRRVICFFSVRKIQVTISSFKTNGPGPTWVGWWVPTPPPPQDVKPVNVANSSPDVTLLQVRDTQMRQG